jgi:NitT/TauT family transport system permease protein
MSGSVVQAVRKRLHGLRPLRLLSPLLGLLVWDAVVRTGTVNPLFLPAPLEVLQVLTGMVLDGSLLHSVLASLKRVGQGFVYGAALGIVGGLAVGWSRTIEDLVDPLVAAVYPIPKSALFPLFLLWFGIGDASKVATITVGVLFLVLISTVTGVRTLNPLFLKAAQDLGATTAQMFLKVLIPGVLPHIFTGLRLGAGMALILVFITEMEATREGLGYMLWESYQLMHVKRVFSGVVVFGLLGIGSTALLRWMEHRLCPWHQA